MGRFKLKLSKELYLALFGIMLFLIIVSIYIEKRYTAKTFIEKPEIDYAQTNIRIAQQTMDQLKGRILNYNVDISSKNVFDTQAIKLIKDKNFKEIVEKPKDPFSELAELAKPKNRVYVNLKESDLDKKIPPNPTAYEKFKVINYDITSTTSNISPVYAPCDFMIFKTSTSWESFLNAHKVRDNITPDFSKENVLIITSKSELPPGIFKIEGISYEKDTAIINYKVDVFEMAEENPDAKTNFYSAITIPKKIKEIKLRQI